MDFELIWTYIFSEVWDRRPHWECQWQLFWSPNYGMCRLSKLQKYNTVHKNSTFRQTVAQETCFNHQLHKDMILSICPSRPLKSDSVVYCLPHIKEPNEPLNCCVFYEQYCGFVTNDTWSPHDTALVLERNHNLQDHTIAVEPSHIW